MLELNSAPQQDGLIKDVSEATFMEDVVEASKDVPVIVDFWAPWCGPCKTLGPALEAEVMAAKGDVIMAKVNVDENQQIAGQLRVQSIPTVYAFVDGQPVDGFMGAKSPSELKEFVQKIASLGGGGGGLEEALEAADQMMEEGAVVDAAQTYAAILGEDPNSPRALAGLANAHIALGENDKARALLDSASPEVTSSSEIQPILAKLDLAEAAQDAGETEGLSARLETDPDNHEIRFDLANAQLAAGDSEAAIDSLLELFRRDREWNDDAARQQLFKIFESLGPKDPLAQKGRRRLSSMIFS